MPFTSLGQSGPSDLDYSLDLVVDVTLDNGVSTLPVHVSFLPGSQGNTEAQLDEAVQAVADHLTTLPSLNGGVTGVKVTRTGYAITPTEE